MILVTVGTTHFAFERMATLVHQLALHTSDTIIFQHGTTPITRCHHNIIYSPELDFYQLQELLAKARVVITHGGPATIYQAFTLGQIPWVLPRRAEFGEHVNNHQVSFTEYLVHHRRVGVITDSLSLPQLLKPPTKHAKIPFSSSQNQKKLLTFLRQVVM